MNDLDDTRPEALDEAQRAENWRVALAVLDIATGRLSGREDLSDDQPSVSLVEAAARLQHELHRVEMDRLRAEVAELRERVDGRAGRARPAERPPVATKAALSTVPDRPEVASWLDLDMLVPAEVRDEIAALTSKGKELLPGASALFAAMTEMAARVERLLKGVPSEMYEYLFQVTGLDEMTNLRLFLAGLADEEGPWGNRNGTTESAFEKDLRSRFGPLRDAEAPSSAEVDAF